MHGRLVVIVTLCGLRNFFELTFCVRMNKMFFLVWFWPWCRVIAQCVNYIVHWTERQCFGFPLQFKPIHIAQWLQMSYFDLIARPTPLQLERMRMVTIIFRFKLELKRNWFWFEAKNRNSSHLPEKSIVHS